ncbi:MAG: cupin domain-containing protein [Proteobacteria bacterium]|nr:cupin domain-containing protein [Pseudomonadota bacterium]
MKLNDDFDQPIDVIYADARWVASPQAGVDRHMLDRIGAEKARATSIVRYAPNSHFSTHTHDEGEEFVVLEGTFSDSTGDFVPGTYVRNPPGSAHAPWSEPGTTIFVKLRQFDPGDTTRVVVDAADADWQPDTTGGVSRLDLHRFGSEAVSMLRLAPGATASVPAQPRGLELLMLEGVVQTADASYARLDWLRRPPGAALHLVSDGGATIYLKTGHLPV